MVRVVMTLTERISTLAKERRLTFASLERMAGLGNGTIKRWDKNDPSAGKLLHIANLLNTSVDYLLTGKVPTAQNAISSEDEKWLQLIHQLPPDARLEFRGEIKGYLKRLNEEQASVAAEPPRKQAK